jgi:hypothetical protein
MTYFMKISLLILKMKMDTQDFHLWIHAVQRTHRFSIEIHVLNQRLPFLIPDFMVIVHFMTLCKYPSLSTTKYVTEGLLRKKNWKAQEE